MKQMVFLIIYFLFSSCKNKDVLANESMNVSITPRIVGGQDAPLEIYSFTLILRFRGDFICTAFAISPVDLLTAAHCFVSSKRMRPPYLEITAHSRVTNSRELGIVHEVEKVTIHPKYTGKWKKSSLLHDIAHLLLKKESSLNINEDQRKADLPTEDVQSGTTGIMTGWGRIDKNIRGPSERLQMLEVQILTYKDCQPGMHRKLHKQQLCVLSEVGHGCAKGDSGGPLVINNVAVGVHSWCVKKKCAAGLPEIFTNVFQELDFLKSVVQDYPFKESSSSSPASSSSPDPDVKGKKPRRESANRNKSGWFRKITCTAT